MLNKVLGEEEPSIELQRLDDEAAARMVQLKNDRSEVSDQIRQKRNSSCCFTCRGTGVQTEDQATKERLAASRHSLEVVC